MSASRPSAAFWRGAHAAAALAVFWLSVAPIEVPSAPVGVLGTAGLRTDMLLHVAAHGVLGVLARLGWRERAGAALALWLAVYLEAVQLSAPGRSFSVADMGSNLVGAALGVWLASRAISLLRAPR